jgi:hypothetical protein
VLYGADGWELLAGWNARNQFRWNKDTEQASVKQILEFVLARVGLKLEVVSQSSLIAGFYPDFTINPGNGGGMVVRKLLSFVPDLLFIEGNSAYLVNPLAADISVYSYGTAHPIIEGRYGKGAWEVNQLQVEGYDGGADEPIIVDSFAWDEIDRLYERLSQLEDRNIGTVAEAQQRGEAWLRRFEIKSGRGTIRVPVNCGQQMYDVVDITDSRAGLDAARRRVLGLVLVNDTRRGEYEQRLVLGAV